MCLPFLIARKLQTKAPSNALAPRFLRVVIEVLGKLRVKARVCDGGEVLAQPDWSDRE